MRSKNLLTLASVCLAVLALAVAGCPSKENACKNVTCSGHGTCVATAGIPNCNCDSGYVAEGLNCIEQPTSCDGITCSDHGSCFINNDGLAECDCDPNYEADGLNCLPTGECAETGVTCGEDADCCTGMCLKYSGEATGYCYMRDCVGHESCVNNSDDDDAEMCCVDVGGDYFICMKIVEGYSCGNQTGQCGSSCAGQLDSACDPTQACLMSGVEDPNAKCAHECATDNDCSDCADPADPDMTFSCQGISGGATYCLADDTEGCEASLDCPGDQVCIPWGNAEGTGMEGTCNKLGDLPTGTECDEDADPNDLPPSDRCAGFYCIWNHCTEVCSLENDCPEDMVCTNAGFCMNADCSQTAYIGMCKYVAGSGSDCAGDSDCPAGEVCDYYLPPSGDAVNKICTTWACDPESADCGDVGDVCGEGLAPCYNDLCLTYVGDPSGTCSALCDTDADCPESEEPNMGYVCGGLGVSDDQVTGACILTEFGSGVFGDPCIFGDVNADADDCGPGLACLGYSEAGACATDEDCSSHGEVNNPDCANGQCGVSFCAARCDENDSCDAYPGSGPADIGGTCYCMPVEVGTSEFGDACIFGTINVDTDHCAAGLSCLGYADAGACAEDIDCESHGEVNNPDCDENGQCGVSFCAAPCAAGNDCSDYPGSAPTDISGTCYCMPVETGTSDVGDACIFGTVNVDTDHCMAGMSCLGYADAGDCGADADCIDHGEANNPDCDENGQCGVSFCAPLCDAGNDCSAYAGTEASDISGTCYCTPAAPTGNQAVDDPCIFGDVNADTDHCMADLSCLGIPASDQTQACAVDGDCTDFNANHNPDCVDVSGVFYCGVSFCAAACVAGACDVGYTPIDVSGSCFCEPE